MNTRASLSGLVGGVLIGLSAVWLMAALGRIAGVSGIDRQAGDRFLPVSRCERQCVLTVFCIASAHERSRRGPPIGHEGLDEVSSNNIR